jgi:hypothetical protein
MKLICSFCGKEIEASIKCRFMHTLEENANKDLQGHHIAIQAQRTWCNGELLEWVERVGGMAMPWNGGLVWIKDYRLTDGRILRVKHEEWTKVDGTRHRKQWVEFRGNKTNEN